MLTMDAIRALCSDDTIRLTEHLLLRMRESGIRYTDIVDALQTGEIVERYEDDYPYPSCLILGGSIHIVCGIGEGVLCVITAYHPNPEKWEAGGRIRKERKG